MRFVQNWLTDVYATNRSNQMLGTQKVQQA